MPFQAIKLAMGTIVITTGIIRQKCMRLFTNRGGASKTNNLAT